MRSPNIEVQVRQCRSVDDGQLRGGRGTDELAVLLHVQALQGREQSRGALEACVPGARVGRGTTVSARFKASVEEGSGPEGGRGTRKGPVGARVVVGGDEEVHKLRQRSRREAGGEAAEPRRRVELALESPQGRMGGLGLPKESAGSGRGGRV